MAKFTDAVRATLTGYFNAGDQPTEAQFTAMILAIQEGIEEHDHDGTGDGDGISDLLGLTSLGVGTIDTGVTQAWVQGAVAKAGAAEYVVMFGSNDAIAANPLGVHIGHGGAGGYGFIQGSVYGVAVADVVLQKDGGNVGINETVPAGRLHITVADASAIPTLVLEQLDISEGTINFRANDRGVITGATNSLESIRVEVNGVVRRIAVYADA